MCAELKCIMDILYIYEWIIGNICIVGNECYWKYLYGEKRKLVDVCTMDILFMDVCWK
jgi:hypothetical protein